MRFMMAWIKTARWAKDPANRDELIDIVVEQSEIEESVATRSMELYLDGDVHSPYFLPEDGMINEESLQNLVDSMVDQGILETSVDASELWTDEFAKQALACL